MTIDEEVIEACARAAHEANRDYCTAIGDASQVAYNDAAEWQRQSARDGVATALQGATAQQQHEAWCAAKFRDGWRFGPEKNADARSHPCLVPYADLPPEQKAKDAIFGAVVRVVAPLATELAGAKKGAAREVLLQLRQRLAYRERMNVTTSKLHPEERERFAAERTARAYTNAIDVLEQLAIDLETPLLPLRERSDIEPAGPEVVATTGDDMLMAELRRDRDYLAIIGVEHCSPTGAQKFAALAASLTTAERTVKIVVVERGRAREP